MINPSKKIYSVLQLLLDAFALYGSVHLTFWVRIRLNPYFKIPFDIRFVKSLLPPIYLIIIIFLTLLHFFRLYRLSRRERLSDLVFSIIKASSSAVLILMLMAFLFKSEHYSRSLIILIWFSSIVFLSFSHSLGNITMKWSKAKGFAVEKIAIVGIDDKTKKIKQNIQQMKSSIYQFEGFILCGDEAQSNIIRNNGPILGDLPQAGDIINQHMIDRIIVSESSVSSQELFDLIQTCQKMGIYLDRIPDLLTLTSTKIILSEIDGIPVISVYNIPFTRWDQILKRIFDIIFSLTALLILMPLLTLVAVCIKIDSKGPIFFKQKRIGRGGKSFYFYKFRSMILDAEKQKMALIEENEKDGCLFKIKNDPRITKVGRIIRKISIDELPSLWNVLSGEMSLVGPRPLPIADIQKDWVHSRHRFWVKQREKVPPGITGLWQISGRSFINFEDMVKLDIYYVENWSLLSDLKIILKTIPVVISGKGSY